MNLGRQATHGIGGRAGDWSPPECGPDLRASRCPRFRWRLRRRDGRVKALDGNPLRRVRLRPVVDPATQFVLVDRQGRILALQFPRYFHRESLHRGALFLLRPRWRRLVAVLQEELALRAARFEVLPVGFRVALPLDFLGPPTLHLLGRDVREWVLLPEPLLGPSRRLVRDSLPGRFVVGKSLPQLLRFVAVRIERRETLPRGEG